MKRWLNVLASLAVATAITLPTLPTSAHPNVKANALLDADVKVHGTTIEVTAGLKAKGLVNTGHLLNNGEFRIVDQNGKVLYAKKGTNLKLHAKIKNLKPSVEYCLDLQVKGKVLDKLVDVNLKANADQKIKLLSKKGLIKMKKGHLCVKTGEPGDNKPETPKKPTPEKPKPEKPKNPAPKPNPKPENPKPKNPKQDQPAKDQPKVEKPGLLDQILSIF